MSTYVSRKRLSPNPSAIDKLTLGLRRASIPRISLFGFILLGALIAFEVFNYSTTEFAFADLLGDLRFAGVRWATILALAFCSMDFAGIARLFSPVRTRGAHFSAWYLLGAWFLAATMNAMLTWWSITIALLQHEGLGNEILGREALLSVVPLFVATLVWLIRVLMIGTFTLAGAQLFGRREATRQTRRPGSTVHASRPKASVSNRASHRPIPEPQAIPQGANGASSRAYATHMSE